MLGQLLQIIQAMRGGRGARGVKAVEAGLGREIIGRALAGQRLATLRCLRAWARDTEPRPADLRGWLTGVERVLLLFGLLSGLGVAGGLMAYSGERPVNVLPLMGLFAVLPLILSLLFVVGVATRGFWPGLPLLGDLARMIESMRSGWVALMMRLGHAGEAMTDWGRELPGLRRVMGWQGMRWGLGFGLGFQAGGVMALVGAVAFSDVAFGWATTLDVSSEAVSEWVDVTALPWVRAWPDATVDASLVELSRVYRGPGDATGLADLGDRDARVLGGWWRYLLMAMLVYGLLPRGLCYAWAVWRLRVESVSVLVGTPGVRDVLLDLYEGGRNGGEGIEANSDTELAQSSLMDPHPTVVLFGVGVDPEVIPWRSWLDRGWAGAYGALDDRGAMKGLNPAGTDGGSRSGDVLVMIRGWEPPVGDVLDDLAGVSERLGDAGPRLVVVLLANESGLAEESVADWRRALAGIRGGRVAVVVKRMDGGAANGS